jgi:hypothetical protein
MRCWAVEIELGGRAYEIPALPAIEWWPVLTSGDVNRILDFIESRPDDPRNVDDLLLSGEFSAEELTEALTDAVEETAGRSFHAALVLATVANRQWPAVGGALALAGFRWDQQPLSAALDAVYTVIVERLKKDALDQFLALLENESLTATGKRRDRDREKIMSEFEAMAGSRPTTGAVATSERSGSERPRTRPRLQPPRRAARSASPTRLHGPRVQNDRVASSASPEGADEPTSGTGLPPPLLAH